jgi:hypothetical protein
MYLLSRSVEFRLLADRDQTISRISVQLTPDENALAK